MARITLENIRQALKPLGDECCCVFYNEPTAIAMPIYVREGDTVLMVNAGNCVQCGGLVFWFEPKKTVPNDRRRCVSRRHGTGEER